MKRKHLICLGTCLLLFASCQKSEFKDLSTLQMQSNTITNEQVLSAKEWVERDLVNYFTQHEFSLENLNWQESRVIVLDTTGKIPALIKVPFRDQTVINQDVEGMNPKGLRYLVLQKLNVDYYDHFFADFHYEESNSNDIQILNDDEIKYFTGYMVIRNKNGLVLYAEKHIEGKIIGKKLN